MEAPQLFALDMKPGKVYKQVVSRQFRLSMAALSAHAGAIKSSNGRTSVILKSQGEEVTLCNLIPEKHENQMLDLMFSQGENIVFHVKGDASVSLSGNYLPEEEEPEYDSEEEAAAIEKLRAAGLVNGVEGDSDDEEDDEETAEEDTTVGSMGSAAMEEDTSDDDSEEEEPAPVPAKKQKVDASGKSKAQISQKKEHAKPQKQQQPQKVSNAPNKHQDANKKRQRKRKGGNKA